MGSSHTEDRSALRVCGASQRWCRKALATATDAGWGRRAAGQIIHDTYSWSLEEKVPWVYGYFSIKSRRPLTLTFGSFKQTVFESLNECLYLFGVLGSFIQTAAPRVRHPSKHRQTCGPGGPWQNDCSSSCLQRHVHRDLEGMASTADVRVLWRFFWGLKDRWRS